ncbi:MAG: amphi-Trp domain-containing protein [Myxococcota bacterium]
MGTDEERDIEKEVGRMYFASTLRRIAEAIENNAPIRIQVAGQRLVVPVDAQMNIAHEFEEGTHELEFEFVWSNTDA